MKSSRPCRRCRCDRCRRYRLSSLRAVRTENNFHSPLARRRDGAVARPVGRGQTRGLEAVQSLAFSAPAYTHARSHGAKPSSSLHHPHSLNHLDSRPIEGCSSPNAVDCCGEPVCTCRCSTSTSEVYELNLDPTQPSQISRPFNWRRNRLHRRRRRRQSPDL